MRFLTLCAVIACASDGSSQGLLVHPSAVPGIETIGPASSSFEAAVAEAVGTDRPDGLTAWLPYGVAIRNNSAQTLAAIAVEWLGSFHGGPLSHGASVLPAWFDDPEQQVKPGRTIVALPQSILQLPRDLRSFERGRGMGNLLNFQSAGNLEVRVDGVVFASGQFSGTDDLKEYEQWEAQINAPRKLAAAILAKQQSAPISDTLAWLRTLAAERSRDDFNTRETAATARQMLGMYSNKGEAELYSTAKRILEQPAFPLHR
jgi:hypothetical protein